MQFLPNFRQSSWIRILKRHNMEQIGCLLGFSGKITAVLKLKKSQIDTENDKKSKFFVVHSFYAIFVNILTHFAEWNVKKRQHGTNFSPLGFFEEVIAVF